MTVDQPRLGGVARAVGSTAGVGLAIVGLTSHPASAMGGVVVGVFVGGGMAIRLQDRPKVDRRAARRSVVTAGVAALWLCAATVVATANCAAARPPRSRTR